MKESFQVFVHREPEDIRRRSRILTRPGLIVRIDENKWKLTWGNQYRLFSDEKVHLLAIGGTVDTPTHGRLSLSLRADIGGKLAVLAESLFMKQVA